MGCSQEYLFHSYHIIFCRECFDTITKQLTHYIIKWSYRSYVLWSYGVRGALVFTNDRSDFWNIL